MAIDWTRGYSSEIRLFAVNRDTWSDDHEIGGVLSVGVSRDFNSDLVETGTLELDGDAPASNTWVRVYMTAVQDGRERIPVATLVAVGSDTATEKGAATVSTRLKSVLLPAAESMLRRGAFAPEGADGAQYAADLLRECLYAPVEVEGNGFTIDRSYTFDLDSSYLSAARTLLDAGNYRIRISGDGTVTVAPKATEPSLLLDRAGAGLLVPGVNESFDASDVPNRYTVVDDDSSATASNEDDGDSSYRSRGWWKDEVDTSPTLVDNETLASYAQRRLAEMRTLTREFSYTREFVPDVTAGDMVRASIPANGLDGDLVVLRQNLGFSHGITVSETAGEEVMV